ncbi:hypothetical protein K0U07_05195, partial [bacterium]|nr:hypothetical protein [bacterium]
MKVRSDRVMEFFSKLLISWGVGESFSWVLAFLISLGIIITIAYSAHILFKIYLHRRLNKYLEKKGAYWGRYIIDGRIVHRLSHLVPAIIIYTAVPLLSSPNLAIDNTIIRFIQAIMMLYILLACILVFNSALFIGENIYKRQKGNKRHPIKSYLQVL